MESVIDTVTPMPSPTPASLVLDTLRSAPGHRDRQQTRARRGLLILLLLGAVIGLVLWRRSQASQVEDAAAPIDPEAAPTSRHPPRKQDVDGPASSAVDMRAGVVTAVEPFPEARKPALKIEVDFGPVVGRLWSSAQITNYERRASCSAAPSWCHQPGERGSPGFRSQVPRVWARSTLTGPCAYSELPEGVLPGSAIA